MKSQFDVRAEARAVFDKEIEALQKTRETLGGDFEKLVELVLNCRGKVILTGGGVVKDERNYAPLRQNGRIYHLWRELEVLPVEGRPLSQGSGAETLWNERKALYERFRDVLVDNNGAVEDTANAIWRDFCEDLGT